MPPRTWTENKSVTRLLMPTLETHSSIDCHFGKESKDNLLQICNAISYQIKKGASDFHARHAIHAIS
jgi:hypothetical protein